MVLAVLCFTPMALGEVQRQAWGSVSWEAWLGLVYGSTAGMVVAMILWGKAIHRLGWTQAMVYVYLEPVSAVLLAVSVLGEVLSLIQAVGAVLAFVGVGLTSCR
jgi:drug/metabolite transporter (DMT)-like permease